ncbi:PHP domain-containing protein [Candidatus Poribacteria bacterium]|nr:PHP domain-containing protein [Candidatus Poribacteria bacterium]MYH79754.1 PHP domain-containing protein [Candidatus Poribacteria bacterium]MYK96821.1 PHP domain-containing protein [Candidatus Poribacteria bacterium]
MTNREISAVFRAIGSLLEIRGDDAFRARIYARAADVIEDFPYELAAEAPEQDAPGYNRSAVEQLRATPGIGKAIQDKTVEMLETGRCKYYDNLTAEMGTGILEVLELRGVGVKTVGRFYQELGVRNLEDLQTLLESGKLNNMKGFGKKTLQMIAESLAFRMELREARPLWAVLPIAQRISENLAQFRWIKRKPEFTGHLRRHEEICRGIELIAECQDASVFQFEKGVVPDSLQAFLEPFSQTQIVFKTGDQTEYLYDSNSASFIEKSQNEPTNDIRDMLPVIQFYIDQDFPVSIYLCTAATSELTLFLTTAADAHFDALPDCPSPRTTEHGTTEAEIYEKLGLAYIPPELRQDGTSVAAAQANTLPDLVEFADLRGDLHAHTDSSDGRNTLQEMVAAAKADGLEYFAITDHSVSSTVANGLDQERLLEQVKQVRELDAEIEGITLLAGSEVDIRRSGTLDFPDEILAQLDIIVASVHSHFNLTEAEMTKRIVRAIEHPFVNIIGHPTGRMLGHRLGYPLNLEEVIAAAAENSTVLEINGSPSRLDLDPRFVRMAKDAGVLLAVNTDAHAIRQLTHRHSGLNVARRGWLTKTDVINTYTLEELRERCGIGVPS